MTKTRLRNITYITFSAGATTERDMSLTQAATFECPYCMTLNDIEIDQDNDIGQTQIVDCQICCQPIDITIYSDEFGLIIDAKRDDE